MSQVHLLTVPCEHEHLQFHILTLTQATKQADFSCLQYHAAPEVFGSSNTKILLLTVTPNNILAISNFVLKFVQKHSFHVQIFF